MFCSKCGRTLTMEDNKCPHCGNPVGESRFEGTPYTSAQPHIAPNAPTRQVTAAYTRTTYTTIPEERQQEGDVDSRTTYRPVYEGASAPEEIRRDMRAAVNGADEAPQAEEKPAEPLSEEAINTLNAVDEELKMENMDTSQLRSRPIESTGRAGISAGVEDYIQKLEANQSRRAARRRRGYEENAEEGYATPEDQAVYDDLSRDSEGIDTDQNEVFDDIDEEAFDDMRYGRTLGLKDILKVAGIMVLAAALIVGGVMWFRHVRGRTSSAKIEGVTESLYADGIALIKSHVENDYITDLVSVYRQDGSIGLAQRASSDAAVIDGLLPAEESRAINDQLFVSVLQTIQSNIGNAVYMDATSASSGSATGAEDSSARWAIVNNAIAQLENASTAAELTSILNGEQVTVTVEVTPSPTPEITYPTLQKGDKSDAVLELQTRLYLLGFLEGDRDGDFGSKTQTAVKLFQSYVGMEVTGIADNETQKLLFSDDAPLTSNAKMTPTPAPTSTVDTSGLVGGTGAYEEAQTSQTEEADVEPAA